MADCNVSPLVSNCPKIKGINRKAAVKPATPADKIRSQWAGLKARV
jgi:hypothetical protein